MTAYLVLASPGAETPDERSVVVADNFALWAFIAPVIWLMVNRMWLEAVAAVLVLAVASLLAADAGLAAVGLAVGLALSLITALEGRNWRISALQRRGWRLVDLVEADDPDTAFEIHAARVLAGEKAPAPHKHRPNPYPLVRGRPGGDEMGSIGLVPVERK
ncbi:MAG: DUF2628 domain-containing protein [Hoeflea sp.]|nr:DUF2628 domain-containing protein [Hoeflea sp.]